MKAVQFTVEGVTYETPQLTIGDALDADWLASRFIQWGYSEAREWRQVQAYTGLLLSTRVVSGDTPDWMVDVDGDQATLEAGLRAFLKAPRKLNIEWNKARSEAEREDNAIELTALADPNA